MEISYDQFLNREVEINGFKDLLAHRRHRILLLNGPAGVGKSSLLAQLQEMCTGYQVASAVVDFRRHKVSLSDPDAVIGSLRDQLGGSFADQLGQAEAQILQELSPGVVRQTTTNFAEAWIGTPAPASQAASTGVQILGPTSVRVGGSIVGGNQTIIKDSTVFLNAANGQLYLNEEIGRRRNLAFRQSLRGLLADRKVILFFDHFEQTTGVVDRWVNEQVLDLQKDPGGAFQNMWVVIAGRTVPLQDQVEEWRNILRSQRIGPLQDDVIFMFWVDRCGLDRTIVDAFIKGSKRNTKLLFMMLLNYAESTATQVTDRRSADGS